MEEGGEEEGEEESEEKDGEPWRGEVYLNVDEDALKLEPGHGAGCWRCGGG